MKWKVGNGERNEYDAPQPARRHPEPVVFMTLRDSLRQVFSVHCSLSRAEHAINKYTHTMTYHKGANPVFFTLDWTLAVHQPANLSWGSCAFVSESFFQSCQRQIEARVPNPTQICTTPGYSFWFLCFSLDSLSWTLKSYLFSDFFCLVVLWPLETLFVDLKAV